MISRLLSSKKIDRDEADGVDSEEEEEEKKPLRPTKNKGLSAGKGLSKALQKEKLEADRSSNESEKEEEAGEEEDAGEEDDESDAPVSQTPAKGEAVKNDPNDEEPVMEAEDEEDDELTTNKLGDFDDTRNPNAEIKVDTFEELRLEQVQIQAANDAWRLFLNTAESREAAGEAIYSAIFEGAPSLQSLFTTPRAVAAMRFLNGLAGFVGNLDDPAKLKVLVETHGFGHLHLDVTVPRVVIFRDAILDLFSVELAEEFVTAARDGWKRLLNYVGGAIIFVRAHYAERLNTLLSSWRIVNDASSKEEKGKVMDSSEIAMAAKETGKGERKKSLWSRQKPAKTTKTDSVGGDKEGASSSSSKADSSNNMNANQVPKTYNEMFLFNAAVMGFGNNAWFNEVLACFHNIVTNVSNSQRLQEECDVLVLRISKVTKTAVNFAEYRSCMLASLRSLLPKDWSTAHEVAWSWLWENVERLLAKTMGYPPKWEKALNKVLNNIDETQAFELRKEVYANFFTTAPTGQDYFKQSNTYLHFIADRVLNLTLELYVNPVKVVDDVSAIGLRHVGYGVPPELFSPFVTSWVEAISTTTNDDDAIESFRWSLGLTAKMVVRAITEGSTIVMRAINSNSMKQLKKAVGCAPRGERANWMLIVQVGTQNISPLSWSIESGALEAASAMLQDLLTFRADRDRYYYGMDQVFTRHPDLIHRLCLVAPVLLPVVLDGLIWRSRTAENGQRRVNYYFKHMLLDANGKFSPTLSWISATQDPKLVCHPVIVLLSDIVWSRVAGTVFLYRKSWFFFTLLVFIYGQSIMKHAIEGEKGETERIMVFVFRAFIYVFNLSQLLYNHISKCYKACKAKDVRQICYYIPIPKYLENWQDFGGFILMTCLICMLILEPIIWCVADSDGELFTADCETSKQVKFSYSFFSMCAVFLYFTLLIDLAVMSTKVSAYVLVCIRMFSEVGLFLLALIGTMVAFSSAISVLKHDQKDFEGIHKGLLSLLEMTMRMYDGTHFELYEEDPVVLICVFVFLLIAQIFLVNMLIAQLTCAYESVYIDMVGYARLERVEIITVTMPQVSEKRWRTFINNMKLDSKVEFNPGDIGVTGGIQTTEPASANPTTADLIRRFGGSTSVELQWPADDEGEGDENDRFDRLENLIQKTLKRITKSGGKKRRWRDWYHEWKWNWFKSRQEWFSFRRRIWKFGRQCGG
jgi:hypothetical protein